MTQEHPITPPPELVEQRWNRAQVGGDFAEEFATFFARWGADQELEACCKWLVKNDWKAVHQHLRAARRPKPLSLKLSLKEKALLQLNTLNADLGMHGLGCDLSQIRRALESLTD